MNIGDDIRTTQELHDALKWIGLRTKVTFRCPNHPLTNMVIERIVMTATDYHIDWLCPDCLRTKYVLDREISYWIDNLCPELQSEVVNK